MIDLNYALKLAGKKGTINIFDGTDEGYRVPKVEIIGCSMDWVVFDWQGKRFSVFNVSWLFIEDEDDKSTSTS